VCQDIEKNSTVIKSGAPKQANIKDTFQLKGPSKKITTVATQVKGDVRRMIHTAVRGSVRLQLVSRVRVHQFRKELS